MSSDEYYSNYPNGDFYPVEAKERVSETTFKFKTPDDQFYYLVIDNEDNSRSNDAIPTGTVTVDYEYDNAIADDLEDAWNTAMLMCIIGVVVAVVVVIIIIVVIVMLIKGKDKPPQYPPQQPYQQQPGYQQYQQPPGYPPQQPPYQPPPQQPPPQGPPPQQPY
jgi:hypothetical protein